MDQHPTPYDETAMLQALIDKGGLVMLPAGTFMVSNPTGQAACALNVTRDNTVIRGAGRGVTIIKLAPGQPDFTRVFNLKNRRNVTIESLTIDGNDVEQAGYTTSGGGNEVEHQAAVFVWGGEDLSFANLEIIGSGGDGIYLFDHASQVSISRCFFRDNRRVSLNIQSFDDCTVRGCVFTRARNEPHIKCEPDNPGETGDGLTITGCTFRGDTRSYGICLSGLDAGTVFRNVAISANTFRDLAWAVVMGAYGENWSITGNTILGCGAGIAPGTYSTAYGYDACRNYAITGNVVGNLIGTSLDNNVGIGLANCTGAVVSGNIVEGKANRFAYVFKHCDGVTLDGRGEVGDPEGTALLAYRCRRMTIRGDYAVPNGQFGSRGISLQDDENFLSSDLYLPDVRIYGTPATGVQAGLCRATVDCGRVVAPSAAQQRSGSTHVSSGGK